ncbi:sensor histidine kinase [Rhodobacter sp. NSM]|uniref:sensor histidine kinase n=1 Tax=Rhodobacter sp. NSM TaxID=3457501 RepID=UPI003FD0358C
MPFRTGRDSTTTWLFLLGGVLIALLAGSATFTSLRAERTFEAIVQERATRRHAADLLSALQDIEVGQRGYLITSDSSFLEPYEQSLASVPLQLEALETDRLKLGREGNDELRDLVERRLAIAARTIEAARAGDVEGGRAIVANGEGRAVMDRIREILTTVIDESDARNARGIGSQHRLNVLLQALSVLGGLATLAIIGAAVLVLRRQIVALRKADEDMRRLNASLEERVQQRTVDLIAANQEVQRFAYIVTHDLRAPLVNIMGFTSELETALKPLQAYVLADGAPVSESDIHDARTAAAEDLPEALEFIRSSTRKMDGLINAILKISRDGRRELRPAPLDLEALVRQSLDTVQHQIVEAGGEAQMSVEVPKIVSDRLVLEQALGNLLDNAVKYAKPGRPLRLYVRVRPEGPRLVVIEVEDNGRGIRADDHDRVFDLFRRSGAQDKPGEGIGLAHVRTLMRNIGGEITLRSVEGQGATFILHVPTDLRRVLDEVKA